MMANAATANEVTRFTLNTTNFSFEEPISFIERGIEFFVFPNGDFDFNTRPQDSQGDFYYRTAGRKATGNSASRRAVNYGVRIEHDSFGRVRRVGNTFINYDYNDRVYRIGSVYMRYNRFALSQIGGLKIIYNRRGEIVNTIGSVKRWYNTGYTNYHDNTRVDTNCNSTNNTNDYYYFRQDGTRAKVEERK